MAGKLNVHQLQEHLECPLCFELFQDARFLNCLHTFCGGCLAKYLSQQRVKKSLVCPICRETTSCPTGDLRSLKPNLIVNRLTESWRSVSMVGSQTTNGGLQSTRSPTEGAMCSSHEKETLTQYCCVCMVAICRDCIVEDHRNHTFDELAVAVEKMKQDIKRAMDVTTSVLPKLDKARLVIMGAENERHFSGAALALENEINMAADSALDLVTDAINRQRVAKLAVAAALTDAANGALMDKMRQNAVATFKLARAVTNSHGSPSSLVDIANIYPELRRKLGNIVDSGIDGGLLDNIGGLGVPSFTSNSQIVRQVDLGRLYYPARWRLTRVFTLPPNRIGGNLSMRAVHDGKLAIGYRNGGIDIFDPVRSGHHQSILGDVMIMDFCVLQDDVIGVVSLSRKLILYSPQGNQLDVTFNTPPTSGLMSVDVDEMGALIVGFSEHKFIHVYDKNGGGPTKVIDLGDFDPWKVYTTKMGRIITKNLHFIKVFDRSGAVKATISETPPLCTFATTDKSGGIFTVVLRKKERISVAKHRFDGTLEEVITDEQAVYKINDEKYWFGLAALSKNCLAVSDTRSVFIYRNTPILPELMKLAK